MCKVRRLDLIVWYLTDYKYLTDCLIGDGPGGPFRAAAGAPGVARYSVYLLYWYKSTDTDAKEAAAGAP